MGSSAEHENPWESAANDQMWNVSQEAGAETTTTTAAALSRPTTATATARNSRRTTIAWSKCSPTIFPMTLDLGMGILLVIYTFLELWQKEHVMAIGVLLWAGLLVTRAVLLKLDILWTFCSALTFLLACLYGLVALVGWIVYWRENSTILPLHWSQEHPQALPYGLLGLMVIEILRYISWRRHFQLQHQEANDLSRDSISSRRTNPWWWRERNNPNNDTTEPLLNGRPHWASGNSTGYQMEEGVSPRRGWWPFGRAESNARDDGSVDYASLNEDWASRSHEDPFWWTQEETTPTNTNQQ